MAATSLQVGEGLLSPSAITGGFAKGIHGGNIDFQAGNWVIVAIYLLAVLGIGVYFTLETRFKKKHLATSQNFFVASKSIPGWAVGFSLFATSLSAITFLSVPAQTYGSDWIIVIGSILAPLFAPFLIKYVIPFFRRLEAASAYDYIHKRFGLHLRLFISATFAIYQTVRAAVVVYLPTIAIATILPQANKYAIAAVVIVVTMIYTYFGGLKSIIWADIIQGLLLTAGILIMIFYSMGLIDAYSTTTSLVNSNNPTATATTSGTGGFAASAQSALEDGKYLATNHWTMTLAGLSIPLVVLSYFTAAVYPMVGGQDVVQRYQAAKSKRDANRSILLNAGLSICVGIMMFYGFGTLLYQFFSDTNQSAFSVAPFIYKGSNVAQVMGDNVTSVRISSIWVANDTANATMSPATGTAGSTTYGTNIWGLVSQGGNTGWIPLQGVISTTVENPANATVTFALPPMLANGTNYVDGTTEWKNLGLQDIKLASMAFTQASGNGNLVSVSSIVSDYRDFDGAGGVVNNSYIVPYFIATMLPVGVSGLIIAGILAASQSAMGSCFNAASRCFVNDILKVYYPNLTDKQELIIGKVGTAVVGGFAFLVTMVLIATNQDNIFLFFNSVIGLFGASTLALFFMGMFGNYIRNRAAIIATWASIIMSIVVFLLGYAGFMNLFGLQPMINQNYPAVFGFFGSLIIGHLAQWLDDLVRYHKDIKLVSYAALTRLGHKRKATPEMITRYARFGMHGLLASKCVFSSTKLDDDFAYATIQNGTFTLNKRGTELLRSGKWSEKKFIWLNRFGYAWPYIRFDVPRTDEQYWKRLENQTLHDITADEDQYTLGEDTWNRDIVAYRKYVKRIYKNKVGGKDLVQLEEPQLSFSQFVAKTQYDRYVNAITVRNLFLLKKFRQTPVSAADLTKCCALWAKRDGGHLTKRFVTAQSAAATPTTSAKQATAPSKPKAAAPVVKPRA